MEHSPIVPQFRSPLKEYRFARGVAGSAIFHALLIVGAVWGAGHASEAVLGTAGDVGPLGGGGGGGGSRVRFLELPPVVTAQAATWVRSRSPRLRAALPVLRPEMKPIVRPVRTFRPLDARPGVLSVKRGRGAGVGGGPGTSTGSGGGIGNGAGAGIGSAVGPGTGGDGAAGFAPRSKQMLLPPEAPKSVRGREFKVQFWIDQRGRVTRVDVVPRIEHSGYRKKFVERMRQFTFYPARDSRGMPVAGFLEVMVTP
ncbi:MAG: hypothetical protein ACE5HT_00365 [Gemmatimonadales bacterium]